MIWYIFYRLLATCFAAQAQQQQGQRPQPQAQSGMNGCQIANNFQLSYGAERWWTCKHHVSECFDQVTTLLKNLLTDGKCRRNACYVKEHMTALDLHNHRHHVHPLYNVGFFRYNGYCPVPFFTVGMEQSANKLLQKARHCLLDVREYERLISMIMQALRIERKCLAYNKYEHNVFHPHGGMLPKPVPTSAVSITPRVTGEQCLLPELVEKTLRMRLGQYIQLLSQQQHAPSDETYWKWHLQNSKNIIEKFLTHNYCKTKPIFTA